MNILKTIQDKDFGMGGIIPIEYRKREASRAVIFDKENNVALLHVTKKKYHKLPGGGLEDGESIIEALRREVIEEIGCKIDNIKKIGIIEEFRNKFNLQQLSYCFIANVVGEKMKPDFDQGEIEDGFEPVWIKLEEAIKILENEVDVKDYEGKFIRMRDLILLNEAKKHFLE